MVKKSYQFIIDNTLYDLTSFIPHHPGGKDICYLASHDVSIHYKMLHGRPFDHEKMKKYQVKQNVSSEPTSNTTQISDFGQDMIASVNALFKSKNETYADWRYYTRAGFILFLTFIFEILYQKTESLWVSAALGMCYALIGLNISHDATHGALGPHRWYHEIFKYLQDWVGSSKVLWIQQHVLSHHAYTNDYEKDNDMSAAEPFLVFHPSCKNVTIFHAFQHWFYLLIIKWYAFTSMLRFEAIWKMQHFQGFPTNSSALEARNTTLIFRICILFKLLILPFYFQEELTVLHLVYKFIALVLVEGIILAFLFLISHNYEDTTKVNFTGDWYVDQIISSSTYGGKISGLITGGLNYQIEHHLFPRISSIHYPKIHETVKSVCKKHGVKYEFYDNVLENFWSTLKHIRDVGNNRIKEKKKE